MTSNAIDLCIVGIGAIGSIVAHEIARSGFRVFVLKAGRSPRASLATVQQRGLTLVGNPFVSGYLSQSGKWMSDTR